MHPCLSCGACCAMYRVAFHWLETDPETGFGVPADAVETLDPHRLVMRGTQAYQPRCAALVGAIGERVACGIYAQRPSPCRELVPAWENGTPSPQCDRARQRHGLAPLTPAAWRVPMPGSGIDPICILPPAAAPLPLAAPAPSRPASAVAAVDLDQQFAPADLGVQH